MNRYKPNKIVDKISREADELASRFWERAASDRATAYKNWLNCLKKATIEIKSRKTD